MNRGIAVAAVIAGCIITASANAKWEYGETKDAMSDGRYARTFADGDTGALGVKCDAPGGANSLYIHYLSQDYLGGGGGRPARRDLMVRFDEDAPQTGSWSYDGRGAILTNDKAVWAFVERLERAKQIAVRATTYDYKQVTTVIDVTGAKDEIAKVIEACGAMRPA